VHVSEVGLVFWRERVQQAVVLCKQGGKAAAETILDMRANTDFTLSAAKAYEDRWMAAYGHDFGFVSDTALCPNPILFVCCCSQ
jgi:hypothetical protein